MRSRNKYDGSKYKQLNIRCTPSQYETVRIAAALDGKTIAQWMREIVCPAAEVRVAKFLKVSVERRK